MPDMQTNPVRQKHDRNGPDTDAGIGSKKRAVITEQGKSFVQELVRADIRRCSSAGSKRLNQVFALEHPINRGKRGKKAAGLVSMDKDMAYGFAQ